MRKICVILVCIISLSMTGCVGILDIPSEGVYRCEELGITIDFETWRTTVTQDEKIINGELISDYDTNYFSIACSDELTGSVIYSQIVFSGKCTYYDEDVMYVTDTENQSKYTFCSLDTRTQGSV